MTLPAGVFVFAYGLSGIIGGGGFVNLGGLLVKINILVCGIIMLVFIIGGQFVGGIGDPAIIPYCSHPFLELVTSPFTTVHLSLNVPSPVTGAFSLVVPCSMILLVVLAIFEWNLIVLRPSK
jgi:hypothetical protein